VIGKTHFVVLPITLVSPHPPSPYSRRNQGDTIPSEVGREG
jgi:hypothetical protein